MNEGDDCLGRDGKGGDAEAPATPAGPSKLPLSYDDVPLPLTKWTDSFAILATLTLVGFLLVYLKGILMPFVVALFLVYLVRPLANTISSCRCRRRAPPEEGEAATGPERASLLGSTRHPGTRAQRCRLSFAFADSRTACTRSLRHASTCLCDVAQGMGSVR